MAIFRWWNRRTLVVSAIINLIVFMLDAEEMQYWPLYGLMGWIGILLWYLIMTIASCMIVSWVVNWVVAGTITIDQNWLYAQGLEEPTLADQLISKKEEDE